MNKQLRNISLWLPISVLVLMLLITGCSGSGLGEGELSESESDKGPALNDTWIRPTDGMVMVFAPEGSFFNGE
jgi:hypothetical protein